MLYVINLKEFKMRSIQPWFCLFLMLSVFQLSAQVGIGTVNPDGTSILDVSSIDKGILVPRMTSAQRIAITTPADGLLVYDIDFKCLFTYDTVLNTWQKVLNSKVTRDNYVLVKTVTDLPAPSGGVITLDSGVFYEINGTIALTTPININDAYISGLDVNEDILSFPGGTIFEGNTGGSIRNLTLTGAKAFNISGPGIATNSSIILQNTVIRDMTTSVGSISGFGLCFANIVQYISNADGVTYSNIGNLLLNNQGWLASNSGAYETFTGAFGLIEKVSGFSNLDNSDIALDFSSNPSVSNGVILGTVFSGSTTAPSGYVQRYTTGSYVGYNFTNAWTINCPGIPRENDEVATSNLYFDSAAVVNINNNNAFKLPVTTSAIRQFRTEVRSTPNDSNSIVYRGNKSREINVFATISFTATSGSRFSFTIRKNGVLVQGTESTFDVINTNQRQAVSVIGTVDVDPGDYIEIYVQKTTAANEQFLVTGYNLIVN